MTRLIAAVGAALLFVWARLLYALGVVAGAVVTFVLFSVAALVAGYRAGRYNA